MSDRTFKRPFTWLNITCLDAPIVAIVWQYVFARTSGLVLSNAECAALFLTAWLIYLADRFVDSILLPTQVMKSLRQRFCGRHRKAFVSMIAVGALAEVLLMQFLDRQTLLAGGIVGAIAVIYLVINFRFPTVWLRLPAKEIFVGFLFALGTGLVVLTRIPVLSAVAIFGAVCSLNCLSIACWERQLDAAQCKISVAAANLNLSRYIGGIAIVVIVAALALVLVDRRFILFGLCIAASTVLLVALHAPGRLPTDERTAMADLALLTPLPFLLFT